MTGDAMSREHAVLTVWTIYCNPSDHPGKWALRGHDVEPSLLDGEIVSMRSDCFVAMSLEECRARVPKGLVRVARAVSDDPAIYESWI